MGFGKNISFQALTLLGAGPQLVLRDIEIFQASRGALWDLEFFFFVTLQVFDGICGVCTKFEGIWAYI